MFYKPEKYLIPSRRRVTKRIQINSSQTKDRVNSHIKLQERLRENQNLFMRNTLDVGDINGPSFKKNNQIKLRDNMNTHKVIKGAQPATTKPKRYDENNSFDYSDVNISRRVIRKMVQSTLFDHKPYERAKYLDKVSIGNKFLSKIDPLDGINRNFSMSTFDKPKKLNRSVDFGGSSMSDYAKSHKTLEIADSKDNYNRPSRRQMSMHSNNLDGGVNSSSHNGTNSLKDFQSCGPFAGAPTRKNNFDINRVPYLRVNNDVYKTMNASNDQIINSNILGRNPLMIKSSHYRSNERVFSNPYQNNGL